MGGVEVELAEASAEVFPAMAALLFVALGLGGAEGGAGYGSGFSYACDATAISTSRAQEFD
jgi:hypothetical protein